MTFRNSIPKVVLGTYVLIGITRCSVLAAEEPVPSFAYPDPIAELDYPPAPGEEFPQLFDEGIPPVLGAPLLSDSRFLSHSIADQVSQDCCDPCDYCDDCDSRCWIGRCWHGRCKPHLQESHWGYCDYFQPRPFGDSLKSAFGRQVRQGSIDQLALYEYDFYPSDSEQSLHLTPRGHDQLKKVVNRMVWTGGSIKIQASGDPVLDERRRIEVLKQVNLAGMEIPIEQVVLFKPKYQTSAAEAAASQQVFQQLIENRGQTLTGSGGSSFSGSVGFGR